MSASSEIIRVIYRCSESKAQITGRTTQNPMTTTQDFIGLKCPYAFHATYTRDAFVKEIGLLCRFGHNGSSYWEPVRTSYANREVRNHYHGRFGLVNRIKVARQKPTAGPFLRSLCSTSMKSASQAARSTAAAGGFLWPNFTVTPDRRAAA